ncbi:hypothetical protein GDO78_004402 [Eleutherodactylus coqui]|uniref:Uncharacterized protein n=1 Tax=Eleutherodactylus coqui TaxID=57060 RepID=A0A8J6ERN1_ELECQ|nr:hypothetical protein GDO78_004402 [Eleutherodactylus coqui]
MRLISLISVGIDVLFSMNCQLLLDLQNYSLLGQAFRLATISTHMHTRTVNKLKRFKKQKKQYKVYSYPVLKIVMHKDWDQPNLLTDRSSNVCNMFG